MVTQVKPQPRSLFIDVLRAVAIFLVMLHHHREVIGPNFLFDFISNGGWVGVDLFFVISGFLVSGLIWKEFSKTGHIDVKRFLIRRGFRIYPAFYFCMLWQVLYLEYAHQRMPASDYWGEIFFLQNYLGSFFGPTWSLAVEEHFYLLVAAAVALYQGYKVWKGKIDPVKTFLVIAGVILLSRFWELGHLTNTGIISYHTQYRIDSLLFGVLISYLYHFDRTKLSLVQKHPFLSSVVAAAFLLPAFAIQANSLFHVGIGYTLYYIGAGIIVLNAAFLKSKNALLFRGLAYIGKHSYSIYLWHMFFQVALLGIIERRLGLAFNDLQKMLCYIIGAIACGICMSEMIDSPVLRLRDKLFPSNV